jgi:hypothetical protein
LGEGFLLGGRGRKIDPVPPGLKGKRDECVKGPEIRCHGVAIIEFE